MPDLGNDQLSQYDLLIKEYFNLSREIAKLIDNVSNDDLVGDEEYIRLEYEQSRVKEKLDDLVFTFEVADFHSALQRVGK